MDILYKVLFFVALTLSFISIVSLFLIDQLIFMFKKDNKMKKININSDKLWFNFDREFVLAILLAASVVLLVV